MKYLATAAAALSLTGAAAFAQTMDADTAPSPNAPAMTAPGVTDPAVDPTTAQTPDNLVIDNDATVISSMPEVSLLASNVTSLNLWTTEQPAGSDWGGYENVTDRPAEWDNIGGINDIVITSHGGVEGYVADIGGFLGMGSKRVLLDPTEVRLVSTNDETYFITHFTEEELRNLPDFDSDALTN